MNVGKWFSLIASYQLQKLAAGRPFVTEVVIVGPVRFPELQFPVGRHCARNGRCARSGGSGVGLFGRRVIWASGYLIATGIARCFSGV